MGQQLLQMGYKEVAVLKGGWREWEKAGHPQEPKVKK
ncbi:MAG: hypothetical protein FJ126_00855 [Deltaproteobacteria bacterium]|nr:hypothetical protein [Deltaproteobacteria bacterium]